MKIEYNILWLDDAKQEIEEGEYHLELLDFVKSLNFLPNIELVRTEREFFEILNQKQWDLIMTDYNLDEISENPEKGDEVIEKVREKDVLTEILFYTKKDDENRKVGFNRITFIDTSKMSGTIHNEKVVSKAKEIVELTVRKFQNVVAMRGMIMHETSVIDSEMLEIVSNFIQATNSPEVKNRIYEELIGFHSRKLDDSQKFKKNDTIDKVLKDPLLISSSQRANAIEEIIKLIGIDNFIDDLKINIIKVRNDFAHAVYVKDKETGREYFVDKQEGSDFNEEVCKSIRLNIIKHKNNLDLLKQKLL